MLTLVTSPKQINTFAHNHKAPTFQQAHIFWIWVLSTYVHTSTFQTGSKPDWRPDHSHPNFNQAAQKKIETRPGQSIYWSWIKVDQTVKGQLVMGKAHVTS